MKRHTAEEVIPKLRQAEADLALGLSVAQVCQKLGVSAHVDFLGKRNQVERLIRLAHVLLMPSEMESFGLAALEAMACGVPPVATRVGGVPELITDGEDGFLEEAGDITRLAERATQLVTDTDLHARLAAAARATATTRFCSEKIIPQYEAYYNKLL